MSKLKPIGIAFAEGRLMAALEELETLWDFIPDPKVETLNSYLIVSYGATIALRDNQLDEAWKLAQRGLQYSGGFNLGGESEFLVGEVAYARGDLDLASKYFNAVKEISEFRLFESKDPKYLKLITAQ